MFFLKNSHLFSPLIAELGLTEKAKSLTLPFTSELIFSMKEYYPQLESDLTDPKQPPLEELILPGSKQKDMNKEI